MKSIVVEGVRDSIVLDILFPEIKEKHITLRIAQGFSNVLAVTRTLMDYGHNVLIMLDTDSNLPGQDKRMVLDRLQSNVFVGRRMNIVWMDSCLEMVLERAIPGIWTLRKNRTQEFSHVIMENEKPLKELDEFKKIAAFIKEDVR